ncbi:hypothetical protein KFK09_022192 [Dendrobium nobile]|uniref:Uncharacterized protein n=1 Tax=Dendrobium nobile TaxID=94219 RepID=A0A8T3ANZ9_DENNO|nr:hypothetical protein KFK09_022192 [Dendrobium nobile]
MNVILSDLKYVLYDSIVLYDFVRSVRFLFTPYDSVCAVKSDSCRASRVKLLSDASIVHVDFVVVENEIGSPVLPLYASEVGKLNCGINIKASLSCADAVGVPRDLSMDVVPSGLPISPIQDLWYLMVLWMMMRRPPASLCWLSWLATWVFQFFAWWTQGCVGMTVTNGWSVPGCGVGAGGASILESVYDSYPALLVFVGF